MRQIFHRKSTILYIKVKADIVNENTLKECKNTWDDHTIAPMSKTLLPRLAKKLRNTAQELRLATDI